jgi:hypothetical protein
MLPVFCRIQMVSPGEVSSADPSKDGGGENRDASFCRERFRCYSLIVIVVVHEVFLAQPIRIHSMHCVGLRGRRTRYERGRRPAPPSRDLNPN